MRRRGDVTNGSARAAGNRSALDPGRPLPRPLTSLGGWAPGRHPAALTVLAYVLITAPLLATGMLITSLDAVSRTVERIDDGVVRWLFEHRVPALDAVASVLSSLADTWTVLGLLAGSGSVLLALRLWSRAVVLAVAVSLEFGVFLTLTFLVDRPRPGLATGPVPVTGSFPSGHTAVTVALYGGLAVVLLSLSSGKRLHRAIVAVAAGLPPAVGASRLYEGLHHLSDVLAGLLLGTVALLVAVLVARVAAVGHPDGQGWSATGGEPADPRPPPQRRRR